MDKRVDVLHVLWRGTGGGAERHVLDLSGELQKRGVSNAVLYICTDGGIATELTRRDVRHAVCGIKSGLDPRGPLRVASAVRKFNPEMIHDHVSVPWLRTLARRSEGRTIVATEHGHVLRPGFVKEGPRLWVERIGADKTDLYIAPSRAIATAIEEHYRFPAERIRVIPHGLEKPDTPLPSTAREDVRRELEIGEGELFLAFIGRLDENKGIYLLIEAFSRVAERSKQVVLVVAGTGPLAGELREQIDQKGLTSRVRLLGYREDVARLLTGADIFILPSRNESFGIVLLEAMIAGLPMIATRVGGIPDVVEDGVTGILTEPGDSEALASAVVDLADNERKRQSLGRAGHTRWAERFTLDRCVEKTLEAYRWIQTRGE